MNTPGAGVSGTGGGGYVADGTTVFTSQNTNSAAYTDLGTVGPSITIVTGTSVMVQVAVGCVNTNSGGFNAFVSPAVSGATTLAASDNRCGTVSGSGTGLDVTILVNILLTGLTAGSNTFTLKYRVNGQTWTFHRRDMRIILLN